MLPLIEEAIEVTDAAAPLAVLVIDIEVLEPEPEPPEMDPVTAPPAAGALVAEVDEQVDGMVVGIWTFALRKGERCVVSMLSCEVADIGHFCRKMRGIC